LNIIGEMPSVTLKIKQHITALKLKNKIQIQVRESLLWKMGIEFEFVT